MSARSSRTATEPTDTSETQTADDGAVDHWRHDEEKTPPAPAPTAGTAPRDPNIVKWDEKDPENPRNWPTVKKALITVQLGMLAMAASLGSSIISPASDELAAEFGLSPVASVLTVSLFVLGFAIGPMLWAPSLLRDPE